MTYEQLKEQMKNYKYEAFFATVALPSPINNLIIGFVQCEKKSYVFFECYVAHTNDFEDTLGTIKQTDNYRINLENSDFELVEDQLEISRTHNLTHGLQNYINTIIKEKNVPAQFFNDYNLSNAEIRIINLKDFETNYSLYKKFFDILAKHTQSNKLKDFIEINKMISNHVKIDPITEPDEIDEQKISNAE